MPHFMSELARKAERAGEQQFGKDPVIA